MSSRLWTEFSDSTDVGSNTGQHDSLGTAAGIEHLLYECTHYDATSPLSEGSMAARIFGLHFETLEYDPESTIRDAGACGYAVAAFCGITWTDFCAAVCYESDLCSSRS